MDCSEFRLFCSQRLVQSPRILIRPSQRYSEYDQNPQECHAGQCIRLAIKKLTRSAGARTNPSFRRNLRSSRSRHPSGRHSHITESRAREFKREL